jgi:hypothetical protein
MLYSDSETAGVELRSVEFGSESQVAAAYARSEAGAELARLRMRKPAAVLRFRPRAGVIAQGP